eukprot:351335-Chlamydomonas_euryale.AAC.9
MHADVYLSCGMPPPPCRPDPPSSFALDPCDAAPTRDAHQSHFSSQRSRRSQLTRHTCGGKQSRTRWPRTESAVAERAPWPGSAAAAAASPRPCRTTSD